MDTSDAGKPGVALSRLSLDFAALRDAVLSRWLAQINVEIPHTAKLDHTALLDTLPVLYDNIAETLTEGARTLATEGTNFSAAHGRERATITEFAPHDLIHELQLFRDAIFAVARENGLHLGEHHAAKIDESLAAATRESISAFSEVNKGANEAFIAALSHDLRNPLGVAAISAQLIELKSAEPATVAMARRILRSIAEADEMIQLLLDAALMSSGMRLKLHIDCFDYVALLEETCADLSLSEQPIDIHCERPTGYWCRASMKRVLLNLLSNAQKYGDGTGKIRIRVSRFDDRMLISIRNGGPSIPESSLSQIFEPFERLENARVTGWGLGLPFVRKVAESHGGTVIVDSAEDRGTTFTLNVPIDARPYAQS